MLKVILKALVVVGGAVAGGYVIKNAENIKQRVIDLQENDEIELDDEYETVCNCMDLPTFKDYCCENCKCHENEHQITLEEFMNKCNCENCDADGDRPCCENCNGCNCENNEE